MCRRSLCLSLTSWPYQSRSCQLCLVCPRGRHAVRILYHLRSSGKMGECSCNINSIYLRSVVRCDSSSDLGQNEQCTFFFFLQLVATHPQCIPSETLGSWVLVLCGTYKACGQATLLSYTLSLRSSFAPYCLSSSLLMPIVTT